MAGGTAASPPRNGATVAVLTADQVAGIANAVDGWLSEAQGRALFAAAAGASGRGAIVEIGSWKGRSTIWLGHGARHANTRVFAVDPHRGSAEDRGAQTLEPFKANLQRAGLSGVVHPLVMTSIEALQAIQGPVELLFVDGDHSVAGARRDAEAWLPRLMPTGTVMFHDVATSGYSGPRLYGPCQVDFCDGEARRWYFDQFAKERTVTNQIDPRRDATLFHSGSTDVYGRTFVQRYGATNTRIFWKKYTEYYLNNIQNFDNPINFKVVRYAHVLLGRAEALVEMNRPADAVPFINLVRQRVGLAPYAGAATQAAVRVEVERQRLLEFGMEADRFLYLKRHDLLNPTMVQPLDGLTLIQHDADFSLFVAGKSELLPIPGSETNFNPNLEQNPGW